MIKLLISILSITSLFFTPESNECKVLNVLEWQFHFYEKISGSINDVSFKEVKGRFILEGNRHIEDIIIEIDGGRTTNFSVAQNGEIKFSSDEDRLLLNRNLNQLFPLICTALILHEKYEYSREEFESLIREIQLNTNIRRFNILEGEKIHFEMAKTNASGSSLVGIINLKENSELFMECFYESILSTSCCENTAGGMLKVKNEN
jgi:hypothetical protein